MHRDEKGRFIKAPKMVSPALEETNLFDWEFWLGLCIVGGVLGFTMGYFR